MKRILGLILMLLNFIFMIQIIHNSDNLEERGI